MEHFYNGIPGWFDYEYIYRDAVASAPENAHFVEVGSWKGRSSSFMAVEIINSGKNIKFDCIDTWNGTPEEELHLNDPSIIAGTLYNEFVKNTIPVKHIINPIQLASIQAVNLYPDQSLDFVLLDASHDYLNIITDIQNWSKKIKPGGILAGDDYEWTGVKQAVNELLPDCEKHAGHWLKRF